MSHRYASRDKFRPFALSFSDNATQETGEPPQEQEQKRDAMILSHDYQFIFVKPKKSRRDESGNSALPALRPG
jgi:hypothetical protein